jgi:hypothetical protein
MLGVATSNFIASVFNNIRTFSAPTILTTTSVANAGTSVLTFSGIDVGSISVKSFVYGVGIDAQTTVKSVSVDNDTITLSKSTLVNVPSGTKITIIRNQDQAATSGPWYASLHFANPSIDDPTATEVLGGSYTRQRIFWQTPNETSGPAVLVTSQLLKWSGIAATTLNYVGIFDHPTDGNLLFRIPLSTPVLIANNGAWSIEAGELFIAMS